MQTISRRQILRGARTIGAYTFLGSLVRPNAAIAATTDITAIEWGGDIIDAMKQIEAKQNAIKVNWAFFQGGLGSVLPKIKAGWPHVGTFNTMIQEDWLVTISKSDMPNLADIPEKIVIKDSSGNWKAVPRAVGGMYFGYRTDIAPMPITSIDRLFDAKLKGQVCWPGPTQSMMLQVVALAIHGGGSEKNMEPGWKLMKDLAKTGNIGRIAVTDVDFTNSLTSGETSVSFFAEPGWAAVAKNFKVARLTKQAGMPTFLYQSGFAIMKNRPNLKATLDFVNFCISPEMSTLYGQVAGQAPLNVKATTPPSLKHLSFTPAEMEQYVYVPDYKVVLGQQDAWAKRWEANIAPLL